jgi:hypothetical protein
MAAVNIPLMPKGVEHTKTGLPSEQQQNVNIPLMPKGVEHNQTQKRAIETLRSIFL